MQEILLEMTPLQVSASYATQLKIYLDITLTTMNHTFLSHYAIHVIITFIEEISETMKIKVKCVNCGAEGVIEVNHEPDVAFCEFCYINLEAKDTTGGDNRFFVPQ